MTQQSIITPDTSRVYDVTATGQFNYLGTGGNRELPYSLGTVIWNQDGSKAYRFVHQSNQVTDLAAVLGWLVTFTATADGKAFKEVSGDRDATSIDVLRPAGLVVVAIPLGNCAWIQVAGRNDVATIATNGNCIIDGNVIPHATTDGALAPALGSETTDAIAGSMITAANSAVAAIGTVLLKCPIASAAGAIA